MLIFRFTAGLILILLVSMIGIKLEKDELALKRTISLQHYRMDQLLEERSRLRIRMHELTGPSVRMADQTSDETDL
ncbi:MAG: hypothetical protein KDA86_13120 [Planctomycetaceae bacterium]|nr:hypothetical protein [Planctomycetaceae bacterium]